jgi:hypothetical protein
MLSFMQQPTREQRGGGEVRQGGKLGDRQIWASLA